MLKVTRKAGNARPEQGLEPRQLKDFALYEVIGSAKNARFNGSIGYRHYDQFVWLFNASDKAFNGTIVPLNNIRLIFREVPAGFSVEVQQP